MVAAEDGGDGRRGQPAGDTGGGHGWLPVGGVAKDIGDLRSEIVAGRDSGILEGLRSVEEEESGSERGIERSVSSEQPGFDLSEKRGSSRDSNHGLEAGAAAGSGSHLRYPL